MGNLLITGLDDETLALLRQRARAHNRSIAEEATETLRSSVGSHRDLDTKGVTDPVQENIMDLAERLFGRRNGVDLDLPSRRDDPARPPPDFSGPEYDW